MKSEISLAFEKCKRQKRPALITYTVASDPSKKKSTEILKEISKNIDICEIGFPHSTPIADGYIQTILERFKIPYTHSGVISSSIAMDKEISKKIFIKNKINTPKFFTYSYDLKNSDLIKKINKKLSFPVVVKPLNEGSSVNVYICSKKNIIRTLNSLKNYKKVMVEEFIGGREIQVAIMGNKKLGAI